MPRYEVKGKGENTGRKRRRIYFAENESEAREQAEADDTLIDEITELPPEPPTERQLSFARDLRITIPENASKDDLRDLISRTVDRDKPATERHKKFGKIYGVEFSDYVGKKALFNRIKAALDVQGREKELLSWFAFRVYRELCAGAENAPIMGPDDSVIEGISEELSTDERIIKSIRRYQGSELIWFGEWTSPDGHVRTGGSNRTVAYKQISSMLKQRASIPTDRPQKASNINQRANEIDRDTRSSKGCLSMLVIILLVVVITAIAWVGIFN